jgi:hypothetical protein
MCKEETPNLCNLIKVNGIYINDNTNINEFESTNIGIDNVISEINSIINIIDIDTTNTIEMIFDSNYNNLIFDESNDIDDYEFTWSISDID